MSNEEFTKCSLCDQDIDPAKRIGIIGDHYFHIDCYREVTMQMTRSEIESLTETQLKDLIISIKRKRKS